MRRRAKAEPVGTTHIRKKMPNEREVFGDGFNVVRVSLGVVDKEPKWLCIRADGTYNVSTSDNGWNDEWEAV